MGSVPDQVPGAAVSVCRTCAWPEIVGRAVFHGLRRAHVAERTTAGLLPGEDEMSSLGT